MSELTGEYFTENMLKFLHNKKNLTFLGIAILIVMVLLMLLISSFSFLLSAATSAIANPSELTLPTIHFNIPKDTVTN